MNPLANYEHSSEQEICQVPGAFEFVKHSQRRVRELLRQDKYDDVALTEYGRLDQFIDFLDQMGFLKLLQERALPKGQNGIPNFLLSMVWTAKSLLGVGRVDDLRYMFKDAHVMRLLGFNFKQIRNGYSKRTGKKGTKPIHPNTARNFATSLPVASAEDLHNSVIQIIKSKKRIKPGTFALDAKSIFIDGKKFENAGRVFDHESRKMKQGYKLYLLQKVDKDEHYVICAMLTPVNVNDTRCLIPMVDKARAILGDGVIQTLLIDRGFFDGSLLYKIKHDYGIDFIIPGKENLDIVNDAIGIARHGDAEYHLRPVASRIRAIGIEDLETLSSYPGKVNMALVEDRNIKKRDEERIYAYLTSLPIPDEYKALEVYRTYRKRWTIENNANKLLADHWNITKLPGWSWNEINAHIFFTLMTFNMVLMFRSKFGRGVIGRGMKTIREKFLQEGQKVAVYAGGYFGIFTIEEYDSLKNESAVARASPAPA
jgi:hypothetical protein